MTVTPTPLHTVLAVPRYAVQAGRWNGRKAVCMTDEEVKGYREEWRRRTDLAPQLDLAKQLVDRVMSYSITASGFVYLCGHLGDKARVVRAGHGDWPYVEDYGTAAEALDAYRELLEIGLEVN